MKVKVLIAMTGFIVPMIIGASISGVIDLSAHPHWTIGYVSGALSMVFGFYAIVKTEGKP